MTIGHFLDLYGLFLQSLQMATFVTYNLNILAEAVLLYIFFYLILINRTIKKVILFTLSFFVIVWTVKYIQVGQQKFLDNLLLLENISVLVFSIFYYYEQIVKAKFLFLYMVPEFWIVSAFLIHAAGTFFLVLYLPLISFDADPKYFVLNYILVIVRTIPLSIAMSLGNNNLNNDNLVSQKLHTTEGGRY